MAQAATAATASAGISGGVKTFLGLLASVGSLFAAAHTGDATVAGVPASSALNGLAVAAPIIGALAGGTTGNATVDKALQAVGIFKGSPAAAAPATSPVDLAAIEALVTKVIGTPATAKIPGPAIQPSAPGQQAAAASEAAAPAPAATLDTRVTDSFKTIEDVVKAVADAKDAVTAAEKRRDSFFAAAQELQPTVAGAVQ